MFQKLKKRLGVKGSCNEEVTSELGPCTDVLVHVQIHIIGYMYR